MRSAAGITLLAITLGCSSACGAGSEQQAVAVPGPPGPLGTLSPPATPAPMPVASPVGADSDRDGVLDPYDACPGLPGVASRTVVLNGCPPPGYYDDALGTHDRDGDGVANDQDACPEDPGPRAANGCSTPPDSDGDGVPDAQDSCRGAPGPARDDARFSGCPAAWVDGERIRIVGQVRFASGSAELLAESTPVLEGVVAVLSSRSDITRVRIEGHTDGRGGTSMNRKLGLGRAARVTRFLTERGVLSTRLEAEGIGSDKPLDSNDTEPGRAMNRRVEFHVVGLAASDGPGPDSSLSVGTFADPAAPGMPASLPGTPPIATPDSSGL